MAAGRIAAVVGFAAAAGIAAADSRVAALFVQVAPVGNIVVAQAE